MTLRNLLPKPTFGAKDDLPCTGTDQRLKPPSINVSIRLVQQNLGLELCWRFILDSIQPQATETRLILAYLMREQPPLYAHPYLPT
jgi:hypothetical protein